MSVISSHGDEQRGADAADWVVRLQAPALTEADILAFDAWSRDPSNARAFDAALAVWDELGANAGAVTRGLSAARSARPARRGLFMGLGAAAAAAAAALVVLPQLDGGAQLETYSTGKGEHRTVRLADGSSLELNAGTRLSVRLSRHAREVTLDEGEAVFDVAHDARRPFLVAAGDRTVRDVGTQFDVRRRNGELSVTVAEGAVEVRPTQGVPGKTYRLHPGQRLDHAEGQASVRVAAVQAAEVMGWRSGRLVYRDRPLGEVVADLNQQFPTPIRIEDATLAATPVSGVLVLDDQDAVIRRLALLAPFTAVHSDAGLILRRETASRR